MSSDIRWDSHLNFGEMSRRALRKAEPGEVHEIRCPDVYVGRLCDLPPLLRTDHLGRWQFSDSADARHTRPDCRCVVMVLESPHVDEFDPTHCYTPWPANGLTGAAIQRNALQMSEVLKVPRDTGLVLFNAIPYQCSQVRIGKKSEWKERRDLIFSHCWAQDATKALFRARLRHWVKPGDVVVNACTAGLQSKPKLRDLVEAEMTGLFGAAVIRFRMHHPAGWRSKHLADHVLDSSI